MPPFTNNIAGFLSSSGCSRQVTPISRRWFIINATPFHNTDATAYAIVFHQDTIIIQ